MEHLPNGTLHVRLCLYRARSFRTSKKKAAFSRCMFCSRDKKTRNKIHVPANVLSRLEHDAFNFSKHMTILYCVPIEVEVGWFNCDWWTWKAQTKVIGMLEYDDDSRDPASQRYDAT